MRVMEEEKKKSKTRKKKMDDKCTVVTLVSPRQNRKRERGRPRLMGHPQFTDSFQPQNGIRQE